MKGKLISVFLLIHQANAGAFSGLISNLVTLWSHWATTKPKVVISPYENSQWSVALSGSFPCMSLWIHGRLNLTVTPVTQLFSNFGIALIHLAAWARIHHMIFKSIEEMTQRAGFMPVYPLGVYSCVCSKPGSCCFANPRGCGDEDSYGVGGPHPVEEPVCFNSKICLDLAIAVDKKCTRGFLCHFPKEQGHESAINERFVGTLTLGQMSCLQSNA